MTYKIDKKWLVTLIGFFSCGLVFGQSKIKPDLYLYFKPDSLNKIYKSDLTCRNSDSRNDQQSSEAKHIYHYSYVSNDGKKEYSYELLSSSPQDHSFITDKSIFIKKHIVPYQNLEKIKGFIADSWDSKVFPYRKVFIVEKISKDKFKVIQVQLYFPFSSEGVRIKQLQK
ncbi:hypothetical protein [Pedobacter sp. BMA]|uniref:hypothetical protein n=1 Tax=Pedobacter sp. BMA TaxID=1663685 RepID=UPI00064B2F9F|nr:hypothetical protein [Pedobacter sp. BMA]KLT64714.1 hypothetical protein AB669_13250 [Pedobacter sp. BMA]